MRFARLQAHPYFVAAALFLLSWAVLSWPWLSGEVTIPFDAKAHFQAQLQFLANALHTGQSPFWTPNVFGGSPQIADPQSLIFSPAIVLALLSPAPSFQMLDAFILSLLALAGLSVIGFFHDRHWHPAGALVAALAVAFGASASWRLQHIGQIESYALYFMSLFLLERALRTGFARYGVLAGLVSGMMVDAPNQIAYLGCFLLLGQVIDFFLWQRGNRPVLLRTFRPLLAATAAGLITIIVPIMLTVLFAEVSNRPEIEFADAARGSLHPVSLFTAIVGDLFGALDKNVPFWGPSSETWGVDLNLTQNMGQLYIGALPVVILLALGFSRRFLWAREARFFAFALLGVTLYALGQYTPLFKVLFDYLPGVDAFRRPADATFFIGGLAALLGGYGVHRLASGTLPQVPNRIRVAEAALIIIVIASALGLAAQHGMIKVAIKPVVQAMLWISAAALIALTLSRYGRSFALSASALVAITMTADLYANNGPNESTALPSAAYDVLNPNCKNPTLAFLKKRLREEVRPDYRNRVELAGLGFEWPNAGLVHGFDHVLGYNPLRLANYEDATLVPDTVASPEQRTFSPLMPSYRSHLANMFGLRYIASKIPVEQIDKSLNPGELKLLTVTKDGYIYENTQALPRVMVVHDWQRADFAALSETGQWPAGFNPRNTVLFENEPEMMPALSAGKSTGVEAKALIKTYENTIVETEVESPRAGFLVLNDVYHPWWKATVNGEPVDIMAANVLFRAVRIPAGKSVVRFEFTPISGAMTQIADKIGGEEDDGSAIDPAMQHGFMLN